MARMTSPTTSSLTRMARLFHALSDETRLGILACLTRGERCVCELTDSLEAGQSRLSFHLKTLKDAGLVQDRKDGRWVYYSMAPGALEGVAEGITELRENAGRIVAACCR
jgi:ArsR family transcriptional regulator, arsenate/arsenite/antimonite-responsive transcriptional repressor